MILGKNNKNFLLGVLAAVFLVLAGILAVNIQTSNAANVYCGATFPELGCEIECAVDPTFGCISHYEECIFCASYSGTCTVNAGNYDNIRMLTNLASCTHTSNPSIMCQTNRCPPANDPDLLAGDDCTIRKIDASDDLTIINGLWDNNEGKCINCGALKEGDIYGDASGVYVSSEKPGDGEFDTACGSGVDTACDEVLPGGSCAVGKNCESRGNICKSGDVCNSGQCSSGAGPFELTVTKGGAGSGTVTSNPSGINCGAVCSKTYAKNTSVTLSAMPDLGSSFSGWSGDLDCSNGQVLMDSDKTCTATFTTILFTLNVSVTGSGAVKDFPVQYIDCRDGSGDCSENYGFGRVVTLQATVDPGYIFTGWGDDCAFRGNNTTCTFTMDGGKTVTATFSGACTQNGCGGGCPAGCTGADDPDCAGQCLDSTCPTDTDCAAAGCNQITCLSTGIPYYQTDLYICPNTNPPPPNAICGLEINNTAGYSDSACAAKTNENVAINITPVSLVIGQSATISGTITSPQGNIGVVSGCVNGVCDRTASCSGTGFSKTCTFSFTPSAPADCGINIQYGFWARNSKCEGGHISMGAFTTTVNGSYYGVSAKAGSFFLDGFLQTAGGVPSDPSNLCGVNLCGQTTNITVTHESVGIANSCTSAPCPGETGATENFNVPAGATSVKITGSPLKINNVPVLVDDRGPIKINGNLAYFQCSNWNGGFGPTCNNYGDNGIYVVPASKTCSPANAVSFPLDITSLIKKGAQNTITVDVDNCAGYVAGFSMNIEITAPKSINCDDGNPCTDDGACDPNTGSCTAPTYNTNTCNDNNPCTEPDRCSGGNCVGTQKNCASNDPCYTGSCGSDGNCVKTPMNCAESPDIPCTYDFCQNSNGVAGCQHVNTCGGLVPCGRYVDNPATPYNERARCQLCHIFILLDNVLDFLLLKVLFPVAALMLVIAGVLYVGAVFEVIPGGFETVSKAKQIVSSVIIGVVIIFAGFVLVGLFLQLIGLANWTNDIYKNWWLNGLFNINCAVN